MKNIIIGLVALASMTSSKASAQNSLYPQHFNLNEVTLLDGPLRTAMLKNDDLLLQYDADRLMAPFIRQAGLDKKSGKYNGWLNQHPSFSNWGLSSWSLEGHVGGHYLTALALAIASLDESNIDLRNRLSERLTYCLNILKDCQDAYATNTTGLKGFIGGQPINQVWTGLYANDLTAFRQYGGWVPFYCQHKVLAGLRDAYVYTGDETAKELFRGLSDWSVNVVSKLSTNDMQTVLGWEHGGMNETLADAYRIFGDTKYLTAAKKYSHTYEVNGMQNGYSSSFLDGQHANTQVPKFIGFERIYQVGGATSSLATYHTAATNFWNDVATNRTVCIGGNSVDEHFLSINNADRYISNLNGPESCNSNNMLKLSEDLFDQTHNEKYADFYEGTMYNHILSTQDPETGGYVYFTTLRPQGYRIYSRVNQGMWCCVGTGMENHGKYAHFIYTHDGDTLYVNLFTASQLNSGKFGIRQDTKFPYEQATHLTITKAGTYTMAIRKPSWVGTGYKVLLNGVEQKSVSSSTSCFMLKASFNEGDRVDVVLPMALRIEECPGLKNYIAFKYGPILLGARTTHGEKLQNEYGGEGRMDHAPGSMASSLDLTSSPLLICGRDTLMNMIKQDNLDKLTFTLKAPAQTGKAPSNYFAKHDAIQLEPFFGIHHDRYMCYWYQATPEEYAKSDMARSEAEVAALNARTIDYVGTGEQQSEAGHDAKYSMGSTSGSYNGEFYRDAQAGGYIQYVLTIPDSVAQTITSEDRLAVMCRFTVADKNRQGALYLEGVKLADITIPASIKGQDSKGFYNVEFPIPDEALYDSKGNVKTSLTFRLNAAANTLCPGLYYVRLLRNYNDKSYRWVCTDWVTGDGGRVPQSKFTYNDDNTLTVVSGTGANNLCLMLNYNQKDYNVKAAQKYLVVRGTSLKTTAGSSYLWWLNGVNKGSQVAPTTTKTITLKDEKGVTHREIVIAWDMTASGLDANNTGDEFSICTGQTIFGLTSSLGTSNIKEISFQSDIDAYCTAVGINAVSANDTKGTSTKYDLLGRVATDRQHGIYIRHGKKYVK